VGAETNLPCMLAQMCDLALDSKCGINPELYTWLKDKHKKLSAMYGIGTINLVASRNKALADITETRFERVRAIMLKLRTSGIIQVEPNTKHGNFFLTTPGGQLATLAVLGVDLEVNLSSEEKDLKIKGTIVSPTEVDDLVERTIRTLGTSCIGSYFTPRFRQPKVLKSEAIFDENVQETKLPVKSQDVLKPVVKYIYRPPIPTDEALSTNKKEPQAEMTMVPANRQEERIQNSEKNVVQPKRIAGVNVDSFSPLILYELNTVRFSDISKKIIEQSTRFIQSDSGMFTNAETIFYEFVANLQIADLCIAQGRPFESLKFFRNDTDLMLVAIQNLHSFLTTGLLAFLQTLPKEEQTRFADPTLYELWRRIVSVRVQKSLPI
jgi:hypothetical protein